MDIGGGLAFEVGEVQELSESGQFVTKTVATDTAPSRDEAILKQRDRDGTTASDAAAASSSTGSDGFGQDSESGFPSNQDRIEAILEASKSAEADDYDYLAAQRTKKLQEESQQRRRMHEAENEFDAEIRSREEAAAHTVADASEDIIAAARGQGGLADSAESAVAAPAVSLAKLAQTRRRRRRATEPSPAEQSTDAAQPSATSASSAKSEITQQALAKPAAAKHDEPTPKRAKAAVLSRAVAALAAYPSSDENDQEDDDDDDE
jgi:hypothetical protein